MDVIRPFKEYEKPPETEEIAVGEVQNGTEEACTHDWDRQIGADQTLMRGPNWAGMKGHW